MYQAPFHGFALSLPKRFQGIKGHPSFFEPNPELWSQISQSWRPLTLNQRAQNLQSFVIYGFYHILSVCFPLLFPFPIDPIQTRIWNKHHGGSCRKVEEGGQKVRSSSQKSNRQQGCGVQHEDSSQRCWMTYRNVVKRVHPKCSHHKDFFCFFFLQYLSEVMNGN